MRIFDKILKRTKGIEVANKEENDTSYNQLIENLDKVNFGFYGYLFSDEEVPCFIDDETGIAIYAENVEQFKTCFSRMSTLWFIHTDIAYFEKLFDDNAKKANFDLQAAKQLKADCKNTIYNIKDTLSF